MVLARFALVLLLGCGGSGSMESAAAPSAESAEGTLDPACATDHDCAPDDACVPESCVLRHEANLEPMCDETGLPIGDCVCLEGACAEVPFDAPNGRNARRAAL